MSGLQGKVALITGAKGGLGAFVTTAFLAEGASVAGTSRSIRDSDFPHERFSAVQAELSSFEAARNAADQAISRFGRIDALVHTVGGFAGGTSVIESDDQVLQHMLTVNLWSMHHIARAVLPHMREQGGGRVIAIGSRAAVDGNARAGAYSASKAALAALIRAIAAENQDRCITANIVMPGTMDTPANRAADPNADFTKWVQPSLVAQVIVSVASESFAHVSGAAIPVYGRNV
jgi:3-oxoacyl-[acyl-carrier protein] reductase